jgi:hypothetical protein
VIPDDTAGRPLTPGEKAAIADLERRLLLSTRAPVRNLAVVPPVRIGSGARRRPVPSSRGPAVPLVALLGTACVLVALLAVVGVGVLGAVAVLVSVVATALGWSLLPARFGGPALSSLRLSRLRRRLPRRLR